VEVDIGLTPKVGGKGRSDTSGFRERLERVAESQPHHRDTPPEDVYVVEAGLLARGSGLLSGLPETFAGLSDFVGQRLAAYSCGGSSGFPPASLLASEKQFRRTTTGPLTGNAARASTRSRFQNFLGDGPQAPLTPAREYHHL
jgi:hypothetical protein